MVLVSAATRRPFALVVCTWSLLLPLAAQLPAVAAGDPQIPLRIRVVDAGKQVPRIPEPKPDDDAAARAAFSVEGRKLEWRVGKNVCADVAAVEAELKALVAKKSNWHKPSWASQEEPIPVVIAPDPEIRWIDVLQCYDGAMKSGAYACQLAQIGPVYHWFVLKSVMDPVTTGAHVVPRITYCEPDDRPPEWRPVVYVRQNGVVEHDGKIAFDPARDRDDTPLRELFAGLATQSREQTGSTEFGAQKLECLNAELLIHADQWCRYADVHRVLQVAAASKPAFWKFHFAAGEYDYEARLRKGERFPR